MATISIKAGVHGRSLRSSHAVWATAFDAYNVTCAGAHLSSEKLVVATSKNLSYTINRPFLTFDTSSLAGQSIKSAKLKLWVTAVSSVALISVHLTRGVQSDPIGPDTALATFDAPWLAQNAYDTDGGSILLSDLVADQYNDIVLNAAGLAWIEQAGGILSQYESMDYALNFYGDFYIAPTTYQYCQTFTPRTSHTVKKVKLRLVKRHAGAPPNVTVDIKATDPVTYKPTGPVLATGTILGADIDQATWGEWIECDLGDGTALTAEQLYAVVVSGGAGANHASWPGVTGCAYTRGVSWYSSDAGTSWSALGANYDLAFSEYDDDIAGGTLLVLRTSYDLNDSAPPAVTASADFYSAEHGEDYAPVLEVETYDDGLYVELAGTEIQTQAFAVRVTRGRESELKAAGTGVAEITVDNKDGDYSPENAGGAYYGTLDLGNSIYVYEVYDGVTYPIFTGTIEKVVPSDAPDDATAFILATDGLDDLAVDPIDTVLRTSVKGGTLVGDILDAVPAFTGARDIDTGITTFDVAYFAALTARAALLMLDDQERSFHYIDVDGDFQWEDRHHRLKAPHLTSQYDFEDEHIRLAYEWSKRELYNQVRLTGTKYTSDPDTEYLWGTEAGVSGTAVVVPAGGTATIWATFNQVLASFTAFVQGTHWNTNTVIDKTGVDTSDDVSVAVTQYGKALKIVFTSTSALNSFLVVPDTPPTGSDADRSAIVMGKLYQEDQVLHIEDDATSQTAYKTKALPISAPFKSDPDELRVMAEWLVNLHKDPAPRSVVASFHARANWPTNAILKQMLGRKISDRVTLKSTRLGIDQDFYIDKVVHNWQQYEGLFNLKVEWTLSRASDLGGAFWILEEAGYGELEETTVLGF